MIAIIPARGGSKGLPGKNIKNFRGLPLIARTIQQAQQSKYITKIFVSTDCPEIAQIAKNYGAEVPSLRPPSLSSDSSLANDVYKYTLDFLEKEGESEINEFIVLQVTSPLRTSEDIDNALMLYWNKNADSVVSYTKELHPIHWHKKIKEDGSFQDIFDNKFANRQEYEPTFYPNGAIYVFKSSLIKKDQWYSKRSFGYIMPRSRSVDIDTIEDFELAEYLDSKVEYLFEKEIIATTNKDQSHNV